MHAKHVEIYMRLIYDSRYVISDILCIIVRF